MMKHQEAWNVTAKRLRRSQRDTDVDAAATLELKELTRKSRGKSTKYSNCGVSIWS